MMTLTEMPKYDAYKDSRVEWFGTIPESWCVKKLSHLFSNIGSGTTPATGNINFYNGDIPWLQTGDLTDGVINSTTKTISERALKTHSTLKQYKVGSLVVAMYGATIGKVGLLNISTTTNQACCVLEQTDSVDMRFAFYLFMGFKSNIVAMGYGGGQPNISQDLIRNLRFPFPHKQLQTAIANFLDEKTAKIDDAIAIKERQIALLNERKQILIQQTVTQGLDLTVPMTDSGVTWIGKIPAHWEVRRSKFVFCQRKERARADDVQLSATQAYGVIPQEQYEEMIGRRVVKISFHLEKRKHVEIDDFVISMRSFQGGLERAWASGCIRSSYVVLRPVNKDEIDAGFFSYMLKLPTYINALQMTASFIRDGQDLNFDNFAQVDLFIPPIEEQKAIFYAIQSKVDEINKSIALFTDQITKYQEYKITLINSAVTGKIKVV